MEVITRGEIATEIKDGLYFIFTDELEKPINGETVKTLSELDPRAQRRILDELINRLAGGQHTKPDGILTNVTVKGETRPIQILMTPEAAETLNELNELWKKGEIILE